MSLNRSRLDAEYPPVTTAVTADAMQQYARAYNEDNAAFFDGKRPDGIVAPPMFAVVVSWNSLMSVMMDSELGVDLLRLVHGEQDMNFLASIRPGDAITARARIASIETRATGETIAIRLDAKNQDGAPVAQIISAMFIRAGGKRSAAQQRADEPDRGTPLLSASQTIDRDQTYRYADASGDRNPIHTDENVARLAGLPGVIVHGLCTMAFTSKIAIDKLCEGDPSRLKRLAVRFSRPVRPGETITTKIWSDGERARRKVFAYETFNGDRKAVIKGGIAEIAP